MSDATSTSPMTPAQRLLAERHAEWLAVVAQRRSRRTYAAEPVEDETLAEVAEFVARWRPYPDARVVLVARPDVDVFTGILGSYGKVVGSPHVLVFVGDERASYADQHVGYTGEGVVLEATRLGLGTCWVAGFFNARKVARLVDLAPGEHVYAVSPLGYARSMRGSEAAMIRLAGSAHRKPVAQLVPGGSTGGWPSWAVSAVETARQAPSAMNRQPWRFRFEGGALVLAKDSPAETPKVTKRLDVGIAMLHAELAALAHGLTPHWHDLDGTDVAQLAVTGDVGP